MQRPRLATLAACLATLASAVALPGATVLAADPTVVVAPGDTLTSIARRTDTSVAELVALNDLVDPNRIFAGQQLVVERAPAAASPPVVVPANRAGDSYVVRSGDNLTFIARRFGVTVASIAKANAIADPSRIFAGQKLTIPGAPGAAAKAPASATSRPPMQPDMAARMAARDGVRRLIVEEAVRYEVPAALALAVAWQESGWQQGVVSHAGAIGVMQLLPATAEWVGTGMLGATVNLYDARLNVRAGVRLLRHYLDRYDGNLDLVLAAYYQGQTAADRHGVYPVTRPYIASIRLLVRQFGG